MHADFGHGVFVKHLTAHRTETLGQGHRLVGQIAWCTGIRRQIAKTARQVRTATQSQTLRKGCLGTRITH